MDQPLTFGFIPIIPRIARDIRDVAPGALLANFTNPAGCVMEVLSRFAPDVPAVGVYNMDTTKMGILQRLEEQKE